MAQWQTSNSTYGSFYKLPPREKVKDPQHALLVALAPAEPEPEAAAVLPDTNTAVPGAAVLLLGGLRERARGARDRRRSAVS